jgi:taurine dioxygenase
MEIIPLPQGFGAEVSDFDRLDGRDPDEIAQLQQAYLDHHMLVFRGDEELSPELQLEITGWFGSVLFEGAAWTVLDNVDPNGRFILPFHADITFVEFPLAGISLYPQELPRNRTTTTFISNAVAWQSLPEALQHELQGRKGRHYFVSDDDIDLGRPFFEYWHPICMPHPDTGVSLLFATEHHVDRIDGMSEERSAEVLQALFDALYAPERRYEHVWRTGDLVVWHNLAIQHARTEVAELEQGRRVMRRVQLGKMGFFEQVQLLRQQEELAG